MPWEAWVLAVMVVLGSMIVASALVEDLRAMRERRAPESYPYIKTVFSEGKSKDYIGRHRIEKSMR